MPTIAINIGTRTIDKMLPQQHREVTEEEAAIYERLLPTEIKIVRIEPAVRELTGEIIQQEIQPVPVPQIQEEVVEEQVVTPTEVVEPQAPLTIDEIFSENGEV